MKSVNYLFFLVPLLVIPFLNAEAAEIEHYFEELDPDITSWNTTSTSYVDTPVEIKAGNFTNGDTWFFYVDAAMRHQSVGTSGFIRVMNGSTAFEGSEMIQEPMSTTTLTSYGWFTVTEVSASNDIQIQFRSEGGANTHLFHPSIFGMKLNDDLTEGDDWLFDVDFTDTTNLPAGAWSDHNNPSIQFTPDNNNDDWLVLSTTQTDTPNTSQNHEARINWNSGEHVQPEASQEGEASVVDQIVQTLGRVYTLNNTQAHNFTVQHRQDAGAAPGSFAMASAIFALRLDAFDVHENSWNVAEVSDAANTGCEASPTDLASLTITPNTAGDVWVFASAVSDYGGAAALGFKTLDDGGDTIPDRQPPNQQDESNCNDMNRNWDNTDEIDFTISTVENISGATTYTLDMERKNNTPINEDRTMAIITMELPSTGTTFTLTDDIALEDGGVSLQLMGVMSLSDDIALEDSGLTLQGQGVMTFSDEIALEDLGITMADNVFNLSDEIALEEVIDFDAEEQQFNTIVLKLNPPLTERLGGVFAITCPANHTLTGLMTNGTLICTDLSSFFP